MSVVDQRRYAATPLTGTIGAVISGVDASEPVDEETAAFLRRSLEEYRVLFLPGQDLTEDQQIAFGATWGEVLPAHAFIPGLPEHPEVQDNDSGYRSVPARADQGTHKWHTDHTFMEDVPAVSILIARVVPSRGGDTTWADLVTAYATLPPPLRQLVDGLIAVHDPFKQFASLLQSNVDSRRREGLLRLTPVRQPLVRVDPESGRRSLLINPAAISHIEGLEAAQSEALLSLLERHTLAPERSVRWRWSPGDVAIWSNPTLLHKVVADYGTERRVTQRVIVRGPKLVGPSGFQSEAIRER
jgi:alpha-ketoglutarate-dependent taurine dioxygenase